MKRKQTNILVIFAFLAAVVWAGGAAVAGTAGDNGYSGCSGYGTAGCGGDCSAYSSNLSDEEIVKLSREKASFLKETKELRQSIYDSRQNLTRAFSQQEPDADRIKRLQKELAALEEQFNDRYVDFIVAVKKIAPGYATTPVPSQVGSEGPLPPCCTQ